CFCSSACEHPNEEVVELLLRYGAQVNLTCTQGDSPLHEACQHGCLRLCSILLDAGADLKVKNIYNIQPLIVSLLIPLTSRVRIQNCGISPLHIAADRSRDEILELLIKSGFSVNAELSDEHSKMYEDRRRTALYFSVSNGNLEAAEMLLEAGANPNLDIFNPLLIAVRLSWMDMAELLVRYGADVNTQMSTQPSSFPSAILLSMEFLPILKLLLDNGCNANLCFQCVYGLKPHPVPAPSLRPVEELQVNQHSQPQRCIQVSSEL
ncbi:hypothetical protein XENOCAPTIV_022292, partial [Xenoophorus captivus]